MRVKDPRGTSGRTKGEMDLHERESTSSFNLPQSMFSACMAMTNNDDDIDAIWWLEKATVYILLTDLDTHARKCSKRSTFLRDLWALRALASLYYS